MYDGLLNNIQSASYTGRKHNRPHKMWPYILVIGFCVGVLVGCNIP